MDSTSELPSEEDLRKERNRRYYEKRKQQAAIVQELPDTITVLLAKQRDIAARLAELREQAKQHVHVPADPGKAKLSDKVVREILKQCAGDWELALMISEDLRAQALKGE